MSDQRLVFFNVFISPDERRPRYNIPAYSNAREKA